MSSIDNITNNMTALSNTGETGRLASSERGSMTADARVPVAAVTRSSGVSESGSKTGSVEKMDFERRASEVAPDVDELNEALAEIQEKLKPGSRSLQFSINETLNDVVVRVVDPASDQIIREIPPEAIINMRERLREMNTDDVSPADLFPAGALLSDQS